MFQGNEVDQLFSILTQKFKSEIRTVEDLKEKIVGSGIRPEPIVENLDLIWDWKAYALENLTAEELRNHSRYHAFQIKKQKGEARLRGKRYLFDEEWIPAPGIRLMREGTILTGIEVAPLRIDKLNLTKVYQDLQRYFGTLPLQERMQVQSSWEKLKRHLENLPLQSMIFPKMNIQNLPVQSKSGYSSRPFVTFSKRRDNPGFGRGNFPR